MRYVDFARVAKTLPKFSKQATHRTRPRRSRPVGSGLVVAPPFPAHICTGTGRTCYLSRASLRVATCSLLRPPMHRSMEQGKLEVHSFTLWRCEPCPSPSADVGGVSPVPDVAAGEPTMKNESVRDVLRRGG